MRSMHPADILKQIFAPAKTVVLAVGLAVGAGQAHAAPGAVGGVPWACWQAVSMQSRVPMQLLLAVAKVESGGLYWKVGPVNANGSYDIGLMQINSTWLPALAGAGITQIQLLQDPCVNLAVGAWILAGDLHRFGYGWRAVGAYNAADPQRQAIYAKRVAAALQEIRSESYR